MGITYLTLAVITTDRGRQFESALWTAWMHLLGSKRIHTTAYHPSANGMVKRFHRQLKTALRSAPTNHWMDELPLVLLGISSTLKENLQFTAAELLYGTNLAFPGDFFANSPQGLEDPASFVAFLRQEMQQLRPQATHPTRSRPSYVPSELKDCTHVFVHVGPTCPPLHPPYDVPFPVLRRDEPPYIES
ncbi:uncharacterized protein LOC122247061 [Penaeus japonicus]|uniref:uncharacterized protein LOC122247061 n=1 Tax=Penaeus japonicus TaxID=27405 RepID=UPI001C715A9C|nr:uncharacterized protein LOC122247061 [Penaeus japonicus]